MRGRVCHLTGGAAVVLAALTLGACETPVEDPPPGGAAAEAAEPAEAESAKSEAVESEATESEVAESEVAESEAAELEVAESEVGVDSGGSVTAALPPEPEIDDDPARLMGLDTDGLAALLGDPELVRREPPAEIWQYRGATCVFDIFLYEDAGLHRVTYLEARDGTAKRIAARGCLNELLRARLDKPLG